MQPGTHITAVGADGIGKQELDPRLLLRANVVVCDEIQQCKSFGECSHVLAMLKKEEEVGGGGGGGDGTTTTRRRNLRLTSLGSLVRAGRLTRNKTDITVFDSTGVAVQDVAIAALAMKKMLQSPISKI